MGWLSEQVGENWWKIIKPIVQTEQFKKDWTAIMNDYSKIVCFPEKNTIFRAFKEVDVDNIKVVLIGQDPYIGVNADGTSEATGLAFDTNGKKITPTLKQMYYAFSDEYPHNFYTDLMDGKLHRWSEKGILMLNTSLTVQKGISNSHKQYWKEFTGLLFRQLDAIKTPILFIAWGQDAKGFANLIQNPIHQKIIAPHPASALYKGIKWDSKGTFKGIENFIKENYDKSFEWESKGTFSRQ